jgi:hypothetical protein
MQSTKSYDIFKKFPGNRSHTESVVFTLMESIKEHNLLSERPIMVNEQMEVIDGQHRLEAAKRLGIPIYYTINKKLKPHDIILLNTQHNWNLENYLQYWANEQVEDYVKLKNYVQTSGISFKILMRILMQDKSRNRYEEFKKGNYKFPGEEEITKVTQHIENAKVIVEYIRAKTGNEYPQLFTPTFYKWLIIFLSHPSVDFNTFMHKLPYRIELLRPCASGKEYLEIFRIIYNFRSQKPIDFKEYETKE